MDVDRYGHGSEPRLLDCELIDSIGQALHAQFSIIVGGQAVSVLIRIASDLDGRFHAKTGGIGHLKAQLAAVTLSKRADSQDEDHEKQPNSPKSTHELSSSGRPAS